MSLPALQGPALRWDDRRGTAGMWLFIATEALLFVVLFFAYFYLGHDQPRWPPDAPRASKALAMLAVLLSSSAVLHFAERKQRAGRLGAARAAVLATIGLGLAFLSIQALEYAERLRSLRPTTSAYGSIFYTITSIHGAHVTLGLLMLGFVGLLGDLGSSDAPPHRALHNAGLYWHFVDAVWVVIVSVLYLLPRLA